MSEKPQGGFFWLTLYVNIGLWLLPLNCAFSVNKNKKAELPQRWPHDVPYIGLWCTEKFQDSKSTPTTGCFCQNFNGLLFRSILWMCIQNLKFVALPVPEIIVGTKKIGEWSPLIYSRSLFSQIFHGLLFGWTLWMYRPNLQSVALPVPEIIAIAILGWGCEPPI